jgi:hypothetical protein
MGGGEIDMVRRFFAAFAIFILTLDLSEAAKATLTDTFAKVGDARSLELSCTPGRCVRLFRAA